MVCTIVVSRLIVCIANWRVGMLRQVENISSLFMFCYQKRLVNKKFAVLSTLRNKCGLFLR